MSKRDGDLTADQLERLLSATEQKLHRTHDVLGTLIAWMAQSSNSPIRRDEAESLLKRLGA